tara:strand:- start:583 stop:828 length:246 start_codon:yes stop_codon:yes gene_type:complete
LGSEFEAERLDALHSTFLAIIYDIYNFHRTFPFKNYSKLLQRFSRQFNELASAEIAACLSCFASSGRYCLKAASMISVRDR